MTRLLARLLLTALAFIAILPLLDGVHFTGTFTHAIFLAIAFSLILWAVDLVAMALSAAAAIGTLGLALFWLVPLWILGYWLIPTVALMLVSDVMPGYLRIDGWGPAVVGGFVMLIIGMMTSKSAWKKATMH